MDEQLIIDTKKVFEDTYGHSIYVRYTTHNGRCGIVEIMGKGYVIAAYKVRSVDGEPVAELYEIHDRITVEEIEPETMMAALIYGRKIADLAVSVKGEEA